MHGSITATSYSNQRRIILEFKEPPKYILDAQTKTGNRMTSFAINMEDAILDLNSWIKELGISSHKAMWYIDIFEFATQKHVGVVKITDDGIIIDPAPTNSRVKPFHRNKFLARLKGEL